MRVTSQLSLFEPHHLGPVAKTEPGPTASPSDAHDPDRGPLSVWVAQSRVSSPKVRDRAGLAGGVRFAFYGRVSTEGFQDRSSSRRWQRDSATGGRIVVEYFDVGCTRRQPWSRRPQAAALLRAAADPDRGFDAVVVGEADRAFCGTQLLSLAPRLAAHGVQVWLPETAGPVDLTDPAHRAVVLQIGSDALREVQRARFRATAAMVTQTREQGRYLGGRPPYGYQLVDAGPHPNRVHAGWGRRLHRLDPDPTTAPVVQWIFQQRRNGHSLAGIARTLNELGIACPSRSDATRNSHRTGQAWMTPTIASILTNPRYIGRQVWNRQPTVPPDPSPPDPFGRDVHLAGTMEDGALRPQRWNPAQDWVISRRPAHPALISEADFVAVQSIRAPHSTSQGTARSYLLAGLLRCGICGRRMDCHWVNDRAGYRCRHGRTSARLSGQPRPRTLYVREDELLADLATLLPGNHSDGTTIGATLRAESLNIICDRHDRRLNHDLK